MQIVFHFTNAYNIEVSHNKPNLILVQMILWVCEFWSILYTRQFHPDHAFESSSTIKVIIILILWDTVTKELRNQFTG